MPREIEAKFKLPVNEVVFSTRIREGGGLLNHCRAGTNVFFDTPKSKLNKSGRTLRLRHQTFWGREKRNLPEDGVVITFKGPKARGRLKSREEIETKIGRFADAKAILESLGYRETFRFQKKRASYHFDNCLVEIDTLPYIGTFCEIEGKNEDDISDVLEKLSCADEKMITKGYPELLLADAKKNGRSSKEAMFEPQVKVAAYPFNL